MLHRAFCFFGDEVFDTRFEAFYHLTIMVNRSRQKLSKQRILEVARRHFARFGYRKSSLREIAQDLGVVKGALYYYLPGGKGELFDAVLSEEEDRLWEAMEQAVSQQSDSRAALRAAVAAKLEGIMLLQRRLGVSREVGEEVVALVQAQERDFSLRERQLYEQLLQHGEKEGCFRALRPRHAAAEVIQRLVRSLELSAVFPKDAKSGDAARELLFDILFQGLEVR